MNKQLKLLGIFSIMAMIFLTSCSKDDDTPEEQTKTTKDYLTAGYWKTTAMTIDPGINVGGTVITDFYAQVPACSKDNISKFNTDGTITDDEGATKCDVNDPQTTNDGTWLLSADNSSVTIDYPDEDPTTLNIIQLDVSTFKGSYTLTEDLGSGLLTYTITMTMALQ
ncbi:MAG: lipocalin family protein [Bacteroidales bacterium]|nr:lipocalin family protein [Bacteroidales bacterium]